MEFNRSKPDLVIFDCDGVLVDSEVLSCQCLSEALGEYGIELSVEQTLQLFLGQSATAVTLYCRQRGQPLPEAFLPELRTRVRERFKRSLRPIPGIGPLLSSLGTAFCVASSSDLERVALSLVLTGLAPHFRRQAVHLADGFTRQASPRSLPLCSRANEDCADANPCRRG